MRSTVSIPNGTRSAFLAGCAFGALVALLACIAATLTFLAVLGLTGA